MKEQLIFCVNAALIFMMFSYASAEERFDRVYGNGPNRFLVATGSPGELGLLKAVADAFNAKAPPATVYWKKAGTGEA